MLPREAGGSARLPGDEDSGPGTSKEVGGTLLPGEEPDPRAFAPRPRRAAAGPPPLRSHPRAARPRRPLAAMWRLLAAGAALAAAWAALGGPPAIRRAPADDWWHWDQAHSTWAWSWGGVVWLWLADFPWIIYSTRRADEEDWDWMIPRADAGAWWAFTPGPASLLDAQRPYRNPPWASDSAAWTRWDGPDPWVAVRRYWAEDRARAAAVRAAERADARVAACAAIDRAGLPAEIQEKMRGLIGAPPRMDWRSQTEERRRRRAARAVADMLPTPVGSMMLAFVREGDHLA